MDVPETNALAASAIPRGPVQPSVVVVRPSPLPAAQDPVTVYLSRLGPGSRPTQATALRKMTALLTDGGLEDPRLLSWERVRYQHVQAVRTTLLDQGFAHTTVNRYLAALKGVLKETWRLGRIDGETYARTVDVERAKGTRLPPGRELSQGELQALFGACRGALGDRDAALVALGYGGGLRRSELVALDLENFRADPGVVTIRRAKGRKDREVPLPPGAVAAVGTWIRRRGSEPGPLLLPLLRGGGVMMWRMTGQAVLKALQTLAGRAGVQAFSAHDLRRSFISHLLALGADLSVVARLGGHANVQTTSMYDRRGDEAARSTVRLLHVPFAAA